jgi:hypothetical protein
MTAGPDEAYFRYGESAQAEKQSLKVASGEEQES